MQLTIKLGAHEKIQDAIRILEETSLSIPSARIGLGGPAFTHEEATRHEANVCLSEAIEAAVKASHAIADIEVEVDAP